MAVGRFFRMLRDGGQSWKRTKRNGTTRNGTKRNGTKRNDTERNGMDRSGTEQNGFPPYIIILFRLGMKLSYRHVIRFNRPMLVTSTAKVIRVSIWPDTSRVSRVPLGVVGGKRNAIPSSWTQP